MDRFIVRLASDLQAYDERLDFLEVRFDMGLKRMRNSAEAQILEKAKRQQPFAYTDDGHSSAEVEQTAVKAFEEGVFNLDIGSEDFRLALDAAIDTLPPDEGRVVHMLRLGVQIDSKELDQPTIAKALGKSEKTIRNMRDRAFVKIKAALAAGGYE